MQIAALVYVARGTYPLSPYSGIRTVPPRPPEILSPLLPEPPHYGAFRRQEPVAVDKSRITLLGKPAFRPRKAPPHKRREKLAGVAFVRDDAVIFKSVRLLEFCERARIPQTTLAEKKEKKCV